MTTLARRRAGLWGLLAAKLVAGWGLGWDIRWHVTIGRDSFWIPPHLMTYGAVTASVLLALGVLALETREAWRGHRAPGAVRVAGLWGTRGFHLAWWGLAVVILAAPFDDFWHRLFGIDVTLWSPPHLLGLAGAQVNTLGCLLIALESFAAGSRGRLLALVVGGTTLLATFQVVTEPAVRIAFLAGGPAFFLYGLLGALAFTFSVVLVSRLSAWRPVALVLAAGAVLVQLTILAVSDLGFALVQPVPAVEAVIAADPTSPVAVAHEIARRSGRTPGRTFTLRLVPLLPALLLVLVDARRRWAAGSLVFGGGVVAVAGALMARSPALAHALPALTDVAGAVVATLGAALAGGALAVWLAAAFGVRSPVPAVPLARPLDTAVGRTP